MYIATSRFFKCETNSILCLFSESKQHVFENVGHQLMVVQGAAMLEIIHPLFGWVRTGVFMPMIQVQFSKYVCLAEHTSSVRLISLTIQAELSSNRSFTTANKPQIAHEVHAAFVNHKLVFLESNETCSTIKEA